MYIQHLNNLELSESKQFLGRFPWLRCPLGGNLLLVTFIYNQPPHPGLNTLTLRSPSVFPKILLPQPTKTPTQKTNHGKKQLSSLGLHQAFPPQKNNQNSHPRRYVSSGHLKVNQETIKAPNAPAKSATINAVVSWFSKASTSFFRKIIPSRCLIESNGFPSMTFHKIMIGS